MMRFWWIAVFFGLLGFIKGAVIAALLVWSYFYNRLAGMEARLREYQAKAAPAAKPLASVVEKESSPAESPQRDDLKQIIGIGPVYEKALNQAGIYTFAQLAALTPEQLANMIQVVVNPGRIASEDWVGQAARLAAESAQKAG